MNELTTHAAPAGAPVVQPGRGLDKAQAKRAPSMPILVRSLAPADRGLMLTHFLSLGENDRLLRFGQAAPDHVVENYVRGIDFASDTVFGVFDTQLQLVGVGHLAYLPENGNANGSTSGNTAGNGRTAEFGVSVQKSARGQGIGSRLFERASIHSRNTHVTTLYMHCLSRNATMMHIAKKSGMKIEYAYGEADAYLTLAPADQSSILTEMFQEQAAAFDYALKRQVRQTSRLFEMLLPQPVAA